MPKVVNTLMQCKFPCPAHIVESTYAEIVHVRQGKCVVKYDTTVTALLSRNYVIVPEKAVVPEKPEKAVVPEKPEKVVVPEKAVVPKVHVVTTIPPPPPPPPPGGLNQDALRSIFQ